MTKGDTVHFENALHEILLSIVSYFDTALNKKEAFYHGLMLGLSLFLEDKYYIESNQESGDGRFDIALIPKKAQIYGIILEFKASGTKETLERDSVYALDQIDSLRYDAIFKKYACTDIWKYGIAFYKKDVYITKNS